MRAKHRVAFGVGTALLVLGIFALWPGRERENASDLGAAAAESVSAPEKLAAADVRRNEAPRDAVEPAASAPETHTQAPEEPERATRCVVRGRCLDAETRAPLVRCSIGPPAQGTTIMLTGSPRRPTRFLPPVTTSDEQGCFELEIDPEAHPEIALEIRCTGYAAMAGMAPRPLRLGVLDLGDLLLRRSATVRGVVVDDEDLPVEGAMFLFRGPAHAFSDWTRENVESSARSDAQGRFELSSELAPGRWHVRQRSALLLQLISPQAIDLGEGITEVRFRVKRLPALRGRVIDERGAGVAEAAVTTTSCEHAHAKATNADEQGLFAISRVCFTCATTSLRVLPGTAETTELSGIAWDHTGLELMARRSPGLVLEVADVVSGAPVEYFLVGIGTDARSFRMQMSTGTAERHAGGLMHLDRLPRGRYAIQVLPRELRYASSEPMAINTEDGSTPHLRVLLERRPTLEILVLDEEHRPVSGARAELLWPRQTDHENVAPHLEIAHATTSADGRAVLEGAPLRDRVGVRVRCAGYLDWIREDLVFGAPREQLEVLLQRGASLRGKLLPAALAACSPVLRFTPSVEPRTIAVAADGSFELENAPPGSWSIWLRALDHEPSEPVAKIEIPPSGTTFVEIDASHFAPAQLSGRASVDDASLRPARLALLPLDRAVAAAGKPFALEEDGTFAAHLCLPGRYALVATLARTTSNGSIELELAEFLELAPGSARRLELAIPVRQARTTLLDASGTCFSPGSIVMLETERRGRAGVGLVGADGSFELFPAPLVPFALRIREQRCPAEGWMEAPEGTESFERTYRFSSPNR